MLLQNMHANRVIQKMIEKGMVDEVHFKKQKAQTFTTEFTRMLSEMVNLLLALENKVVSYCKDKLGCRIIQILIQCIPESAIYNVILTPIFNASFELICDMYGN